MLVCFSKKNAVAKVYKIIGIWLLLSNSYIWANNALTTKIKSNKKHAPSQHGAHQNTQTQIGNSYFSNSPKKSIKPQKVKPISQIGPAVELRQDYADFYLFLNQLYANHIFYELRAYAIYRYITAPPPPPDFSPRIISAADERNLLGYGGIGIFGYNFELNPNVSFMPFIRLQALTNSAAAYKDSFGNEVDSINYTGLLGGKLSMRVTDIFALYAQYFAGYQHSTLHRYGLFENTAKPVVNAFASIMEFGAPYRINKSFSVTPYLQFITSIPHLNQVARSAPYNINTFTNTNTLYAIKLGYNF